MASDTFECWFVIRGNLNGLYLTECGVETSNSLTSMNGWSLDLMQACRWPTLEHALSIIKGHANSVATGTYGPCSIFVTDGISTVIVGNNLEDKVDVAQTLS